MELSDFISFRKKITNYEETSFGLRGNFYIESTQDIDLLKRFENGQIREAVNPDNSNADINQLTIGDNIKLSIELHDFSNYYETFNDFLSTNKYVLPESRYFIFELNYDSEKDTSERIDSYQRIIEIITFLKEISVYQKTSDKGLELVFTQPDKVFALLIDFGVDDIDNLKISDNISQTISEVASVPNKETKIRLFVNELINQIPNESDRFSKILKDWDLIVDYYLKSFRIFTSEFSFEKIKTSSQEYFQDLTDRIYSTIHKFSGYILAIPVAYVLIIRFYDFDGDMLLKDTVLVVIGILYFIVIWWVLLNNLDNAFENIKKDIDRFLYRIQSENSLSEIKQDLEQKKRDVIPKQKNKILIVKTVSIFILLISIATYLYIYWDEIFCK